MRSLLLLIFCLVIWASPAQARRTTVHLAPECNVTMPCEGAYFTPRAKAFIGIPFGRPIMHYDTQPAPRKTVPSRKESSVIGGRPSGCPSRFCGCGASLYLFGKIRPELNL